MSLGLKPPRWHSDGIVRAMDVQSIVQGCPLRMPLLRLSDPGLSIQVCQTPLSETTDVDFTWVRSVTVVQEVCGHPEPATGKKIGRRCALARPGAVRRRVPACKSPEPRRSPEPPPSPSRLAMLELPGLPERALQRVCGIYNAFDHRLLLHSCMHLLKNALAQHATRLPSQRCKRSSECNSDGPPDTSKQTNRNRTWALLNSFTLSKPTTKQFPSVPSRQSGGLRKMLSQFV